ncbi:DNA-binding transcriptional regulator, XRE-family HTH domain [Ruminococcus albus]|uniref:DNA-binding transcriptional regulator, XRE-family HTH domain n=2 Tax=Ruminococcus albus TaxID=1264 RepID=A0A1I1PX76_RUMAL|nr:DNA-binding transcriptional regulator, XRE-family HTH domain [Ruminococcus albus]
MQQMENVFPERLKKIMEDEHITQSDLAKKIGATRQSISAYLKGDRNPDIIVLKGLADVLSVSSDYLIGLSDFEINDGDMQAFCKGTGLSEKAAIILDTLLSDSISQIIESPNFENLLMRIDEVKSSSESFFKDIEKFGLENMLDLSDIVDLNRYRAIKEFESLLDNFDMRYLRKSEFEEIQKQHLTLVSDNRKQIEELYKKSKEETDENERDKILKDIIELTIKDTK